MAKNKNKQNKGSNMADDKDLVPAPEVIIPEDKDVVDSTEEIKQVDENLTDTSNDAEDTDEKFEETSLTGLPEPLAGTFEDDAEDIARQLTENTLDVKTTEKEEMFSLTDAIEFSKDNTTEDLLNKIFTESGADLKVFGAELKDIITAYASGNEYETNNGNRKLYSLLLRTLKNEDGSDFKFRFDVINRLFKDNEYFQPVTLLNCSKWTKSEKDLSTFGQLATIIEDLADRSTRNENKKRIANLSNLNIDEKSLENIKNYYKL